MNRKNTPKLRFKEFEKADPWEQRKFSDVVDIGSGMDYKHLGEGDIHVYGTGGYMLSVDAALSEDKDAIGIGRKGTIDKPYILRAPFWTVDTLFYCIPKDGYDLDFTSCLFQNVDWKKKDESTGVPSLSKVIINNVETAAPSYEEQRKIGDYFKGIDNLITFHQRKYEKLKKVKNAYLDEMFPKNGERFPKRRFPGFTDPWEQRKLGELCERVTRKNITGESDLPLTIASQYGLIDQRDFFNKVVAAKDMSNYYLLKKGEFAYNKSYSNGYDFGSIKRLNAYEQGCLSTLYICFGITSDDIESDYLECFFDTLKWYSDITMICAEGARNHGLLNVDTKAFFDEVTIEMPSSKEEQRKISSYLNNLDNLITLHQRELDKLKKLKAAYLDAMFVGGK